MCKTIPKFYISPDYIANLTDVEYYLYFPRVFRVSRPFAYTCICDAGVQTTSEYAPIIRKLRGLETRAYITRVHIRNKLINAEYPTFVVADNCALKTNVLANVANTHRQERLTPSLQTPNSKGSVYDIIIRSVKLYFTYCTRFPLFCKPRSRSRTKV